MAADDIAAAVCEVTLPSPVNDTTEIAGPEPVRFEDFVRIRWHALHRRERTVNYHLGKVLTKLGITSRAQLDGALTCFCLVTLERRSCGLRCS